MKFDANIYFVDGHFECIDEYHCDYVGDAVIYGIKCKSGCYRITNDKTEPLNGWVCEKIDYSLLSIYDIIHSNLENAWIKTDDVLNFKVKTYEN